MVGRVGRYHETHRSRLDLIGRLKARGYSLAAIADLCAASTSGRSLEEVLGGSPAAGIDEPAVEYTTGQLVAAVPAFDDVELREAATTVGLLQDHETALRQRRALSSVERQRWRAVSDGDSGYCADSATSDPAV